jgi:hypothetical protein
MSLSRVMMASTFVAALFAGWCRASSPSSAGSAADPKAAGADTTIWRINKKCGQNCIYICMKMLGKRVLYDEIGRSLTVTDDGSSSAELRDCSRRFGVEASIYQAGPQSLLRAPLPLIAHWEEERGTGHYVVVIASNADGVQFVDGTTAAIRVLPWPEFEKRWSGYVLVFQERPWWWPLVPVAAALGLAAGALSFLSWRRSHRLAATAKRHASEEDAGLTEPTGGELQPASCVHGQSLCLWLLGLVLAFPPVALAQTSDQDLPALDKITEALNQRNSRIESLAVEYWNDAEAIVPLDDVKKYLGMGDPAHHDAAFAFKGNKRFYRNVEVNVVKGSASRVPKGELVEVAYDGELLRRKSHTQRLADIRSAKDVDDDSSWFPQGYLLSIGMMLPDAMGAPMDERRQRARLPDAFRLGGFAVESSREVVDGASCVVVSSPRRQRFSLDPALGFALRKTENFNSETGLLESLVISREFAQSLPGVWLPRVCSFESCGGPDLPPAYRGKPMVRYVFTVTKLSINDMPDSLFAMQIEPGYLVVDTPHLPPKSQLPAVTYVMPADASQVDAAIEEALSTRNRSQSKQTGTWLLLATNALVIFAVIAILGVRRVFRRGPDETGTH